MDKDLCDFIVGDLMYSTVCSGRFSIRQDQNTVDMLRCLSVFIMFLH